MNARTQYEGSDFYCDEVLNGRTQVRKLFETEHVLAFHHTRPSYPVHVVVIPRKHIDSLLTLDVHDHRLLADMMDVLQRAAAVVTGQCGACRVVSNMGRYQDSKHLHWHVISGKAGDPAIPIGQN